MTPEQWDIELGHLEAGGDFTVELPGEGNLLMARDGHHVPSACDYLSRWVMHRLGLEPFGINTPDWGYSYTSKAGGKMRFLHWCLGVDFVSVVLDESDLRNGYDRKYVITDMPVPEERAFPDNWGEYTRDERCAWLQERRPRQQLLELLAIVHFTKWLITNDIRG